MKSGMTTVKSDFPEEDVELAVVDDMTIREIWWKLMPRDNEKEEKVVINEKYQDQPITIGKHLPP